MGSCSSNEPKQDPNTLALPDVDISEFERVAQIGKGGFGKVMRVRHKLTGQNYAMKIMSKTRIIYQRSVDSIMSERMILADLGMHPFISNMILATQDENYLYIIMDELTGGDFRKHIIRKRTFNEEQTKFFMACCLEALAHAHKKNIIHKDIKPENLVFEYNGYLRTTDFGIARYLKAENYMDGAGTLGYMSPEVICKQNHSFETDFYAMGVMVYECIMGQRPYEGYAGRKQLQNMMIKNEVKILPNQKPPGWSDEAIDFCNRLLERKPNKRLGFVGRGGAQEVFAHPWFNGFPWEQFRAKTLPAPYLPVLADKEPQGLPSYLAGGPRLLEQIEEEDIFPSDEKYRELIEQREQNRNKGEETDVQLLRKQKLWMGNPALQSLFAGFTYTAGYLQILQGTTEAAQKYAQAGPNAQGSAKNGEFRA